MNLYSIEYTTPHLGNGVAIVAALTSEQAFGMLKSYGRFNFAKDEYHLYRDTLISKCTIFNVPKLISETVEDVRVWHEYSNITKEGIARALSGSPILEPDEGVSGQVLTTDGAGGRYWSDPQGGGGSSVVIVDSLDSVRKDAALSANQGRVLNGLIEAQNAAIVLKQDIISDLEDIREGSSLGKTALQSFTETDPTVPQWAKQATKPSYTASEVGALPDSTVIPSKTSQLSNDSGFLTEHQSLAGYATEKWVSEQGFITSVPDTYAKKSDIPSLDGYATETWVEGRGYLTEHQSLSEYRKSSEQDAIDSGKQDALVSGSNIKTINNLSILGSGNITIEGGSTVEIVDSLDSERTDAALSARQGSVLLAKFSSYRTSAEQDSIHDSTKQDVISDLDTIRSGAASGATAIQEHQDISGKVDKVDGMGLSSNDFTDDYRSEVDELYDDYKGMLKLL